MTDRHEALSVWEESVEKLNHDLQLLTERANLPTE